VAAVENPMIRSALLMSIALLIITAQEPAAADCPASETLCGTGDSITGEPAASTTEPIFSKMCSFAGLNGEDASFDIPAGMFKVAISEGGSMRLWLRDTFTITGPAAGTPVTFHMRFQVDGSVNWTSYGPLQQVQVDVRPLEVHAGDTPAAWGFGLTTEPRTAYPFANSFDLTLQRLAGEPVGIEIDAQSAIQNAGSTRLNGTFSFPDLPPGWSVTSCKGYHADRPVPALPKSWGHVKAAYR
jgi:hypothetical protein